MKKIILLIILLPMIASAQYFEVFDIDTSEYPIMKAKFYSIDANGKQILNHTPADFEITENGEPRDVISVSCPESLPIPISVGLMVDTYIHIDLARHGAERLVNLLHMPQNEVGITYMDRRPYLFQDFSKIKYKTIQNCRIIPRAPGATGVSDIFFDDFTGGINLVKNREAQNRVIIYITDLHCPNLDIDEQKLFEEARNNNIRIYTVLIKTDDYTGLFGRIANETNGAIFENVNDSAEIENIFEEITYLEQGKPCEISWNGEISCNRLISLEIKNKLVEKTVIKNIETNETQRVKLEFPISFLDFGYINELESKDTIISIVALNKKQTIENISFEPDLGYFKILNTLPIDVQQDEKINIILEYNAYDTLRNYTLLKITTDYCDYYTGLLAGSKYLSLTTKTLSLSHPNGGEVFDAGVDTIITWVGISNREKVKLNFSSNNGRNWTILSNSALNLKSNWQVPAINSDSCLINVSQIVDQPILDRIEWARTYGGSESESPNLIKCTLEGGYIVVGSSLSSDGDLKDIGNRGNSDLWVLKLKSEGEIEWTKTFGGSGYDNAFSIIENGQEGYIIVGNSWSDDGIFSGVGNKGRSDLWVLKLNNNGEIQWSKTFGGSNEDISISIIKSVDDGFIIAANSHSNDGDLEGFGKTNSHDLWILKLNNDGEIQWSKIYGGSGFEGANSIIQHKDGGFIIAANSTSDDFDLLDAGNKGEGDVWVLKLNSDGEIQWSKTFGGSNQDYIRSFIETKDGGFILVANSESDDFDLLDAGNKGGDDVWVLKLNNDGEIQWSKTFGGTAYDQINSIFEKSSNGYILTGYSKSSDGDLKNNGNSGDSDVWVLKLNNDGEIQWSKTFGGLLSDMSFSSVESIDNGIIIALCTNSEDFNLSNNHGKKDLVVFKLRDPVQPLQSDTSDAVFSIIMPEPEIQNNDIDMGQMIVGSTKDTIVSSVICNTGEAPLHVLGVDITGGDAGDFLIPRGAGDFYLEKDSCQDMMFEFTPSALGNRTAVATIRTTIGDFTDTINIRGVGIDPVIEATANVVDFGVFELGEGKDTTVVLVKNVGASDITITDTRLSGPDTEQFSLNTAPVSYTIPAGEEKEFQLNYTAKYGGKTNSFLDFHYDGIGSPIRSLLFAEGIGGEVYPQVADAYVGEAVELGIFLGKIKPEGLNEIATNFSATISYNSTLLAPIDKSILVTTEDNKSYIKIIGELSGMNQIAGIPMKVGLGTAVKSGLVITEFQLYDANGDSVDYDIEPGVGEFNVLGICEEGGVRLINPNGQAVDMVVTTDGLNSNARINLTLIETGQTDLVIFDQIGNKIETVYSGTPSAGQQEINLDLSKYTNGRYYIKLTTPTITKTEIIEVVR
jgi:hypothetical protein